MLLAITRLKQFVSMRTLLELCGLWSKSEFSASVYFTRDPFFWYFFKRAESNHVCREKRSTVLSRMDSVAWWRRFCRSKNVTWNGVNNHKFRQYRKFDSEFAIQITHLFYTFCFRIIMSARVEDKKSMVNGLLTLLMILSSARI